MKMGATLLDMCRGCLKVDVPLSMSDRYCDNTWIYHSLAMKICFGNIEVIPNSLKMCQVCSKKLQDAFKFKQLCVNSSEAYQKNLLLLDKSTDVALKKLEIPINYCKPSASVNKLLDRQSKSKTLLKAKTKNRNLLVPLLHTQNRKSLRHAPPNKTIALIKDCAKSSEIANNISKISPKPTQMKSPQNKPNKNLRVSIKRENFEEYLKQTDCNISSKPNPVKSQQEKHLRVSLKRENLEEYLTRTEPRETVSEAEKSSKQRRYTRNKMSLQISSNCKSSKQEINSVISLKRTFRMTDKENENKVTSMNLNKNEKVPLQSVSDQGKINSNTITQSKKTTSEILVKLSPKSNKFDAVTNSNSNFDQTVTLSCSTSINTAKVSNGSPKIKNLTKPPQNNVNKKTNSPAIDKCTSKSNSSSQKCSTEKKKSTKISPAPEVISFLPQLSTPKVSQNKKRDLKFRTKGKGINRTNGGKTFLKFPHKRHISKNPLSKSNFDETINRILSEKLDALGSDNEGSTFYERRKSKKKKRHRVQESFDYPFSLWSLFGPENSVLDQGVNTAMGSDSLNLVPNPFCYPQSCGDPHSNIIFNNVGQRTIIGYDHNSATNFGALLPALNTENVGTFQTAEVPSNSAECAPNDFVSPTISFGSDTVSDCFDPLYFVQTEMDTLQNNSQLADSELVVSIRVENED